MVDLKLICWLCLWCGGHYWANFRSSCLQTAAA